VRVCCLSCTRGSASAQNSSKMTAMKVVFCHGLESGPHGRKYQALVAAGFDVVSPDCRNMNLAARVEVIAGLLVYGESSVVVGSSYGGLAAVCATLQARASGVRVAGIVLCAPALHWIEAPADLMRLEPAAPTIIVHGTRAEIGPLITSRTFANGRDDVTLLEVDDDHSLAGSIDVIVEATRSFLVSRR
jgi:pimeloyl-ACP methyl ester carboxylesterase